LIVSTDYVYKRSALSQGWRPLLISLTLDRFLIGAMVIVLFAASACASIQSDTWWQLRSGQLIVETGRIWTVDPFSSTVRGGYWPNHEWLAEVLFYVGYTLGGLPLLLLACATLITLSWCGIYALCDGAPRFRAIALLLGSTSHEILWGVRPHVFSLMLLVVALLLIPGRRRHWLYPPLLLLWANLHAGVVFGGVVVAAVCAVGLLTDQASWRHWLLVGIASALATLVNPLGFGLWLYVISSFGDTTRMYLQEWQPPRLDWPLSYPFFILVLAWGAALIYARRHWHGRRDWTLLLLSLLFVLLGFRSIRHTAFFAVVALPLITRAFTATAPANRRGVSLGALHLSLLLGLAVGGALVVQAVWAQTIARSPLTPAAVAAVRACDGRLYNTYDTGGPLIWLAPERPVFVDNRQDPYPAELLFRAVIAEQQGEYRELFQDYGIGCALVPLKQPIYPALRRDSRWQEVYHDMEVAVLRRVPPIP
jgi:hypothetical protein